MTKLTTSKLILLVDFLVAIILTAIVVHGAYSGVDMSYVATIAGLWDVQLAVAVGAYYWKAKNENRSKHAMRLVKELAEVYGIENVINLAQVILKD